MKNLVDNKPRLVTRIIYLIPLLLIYTIGLCVAHILTSESEVPLAHIDKAKLIGRSVRAVSAPAKAARSNTGQEIESIHDIMQRVARTDAARALAATRQSVFNELQQNVPNSLYALKPEYHEMQRVADNEGKRSLEAIRRTVVADLHKQVTNPYYSLAWNRTEMQKAADADGARSLAVTRHMVLESLQGSVKHLFHNEFQYLRDSAPGGKLVAEDHRTPPAPYEQEFRLANKNQ